jgi:hypothetical protein
MTPLMNSTTSAEQILRPVLSLSSAFFAFTASVRCSNLPAKASVAKINERFADGFKEMT